MLTQKLVTSLLCLSLIGVAFTAPSQKQAKSQLIKARSTNKIVQVFAPVGSRVSKLLVTSSSQVRKGQLLAVIQLPLSKADLSKAKAVSKAALDKARAKKDALNARVSALEAQEKSAIALQSAAEKRLKDIKGKPSHSQTEVVSAQSVAETAKQKADKLSAEKESAMQAYLADDSSVEAFKAVKRAKKFKESIRSKSLLKLTSPVNGTILTVSWRLGEFVRPNATHPSRALFSISVH